ncbi:MAG: anti-sigma factor [Candidatus Limnocylindrales bacterium]
MTEQRRYIVQDLTCDEIRDLAAPFVLGALEADEAEAVRAHLVSCPDAHAEFVELAAVMPVLAAIAPEVQPPAELKSRILAAAAADMRARSATATVPIVGAGPVVTAPAPSPAATPDATPVPFPNAAEREVRAASRARPGLGSWGLRIAAVLAIAVVGGWNLLLQGQLDQARAYEQNVAAVLDVAGQPGALTAVLTADGGDGPSGLAAIDAAGKVSLAMRDLAPTAGGQVYEAWVIGGDGTPVPLGSFQVGGSGTAYFEGSGLPTDAGTMVALTLEPGPAAQTPTLPIVSVGTATAAG